MYKSQLYVTFKKIVQTIHGTVFEWKANQNDSDPSKMKSFHHAYNRHLLADVLSLYHADLTFF